MNFLDEIKTDIQKRKYWGAIVGKELLDRLLQDDRIKECFEKTTESLNDNQPHLEEFLGHMPDKEAGVKADWLFAPFYHKVQSYTVRRIHDLFSDRNSFGLSAKVIEKFANIFVESMQWFIFRCILQEMHGLKQENRLKGQNQEEEYQYFLNAYLENGKYQRYLCGKYKVMTALILEKTAALERFLGEVMSHLEKDKLQIEQDICEGNTFEKILDLDRGLSDEHQSGKSVIRLKLDNGRCVYYKPRSLRCELEYQKIYGWLSENCGLKVEHYGMLDFDTYGWEAEVTYKPCKTEGEVCRYYQRMGLHLFLAYVFSVSDLHFENIVSSGEYPVLIDLEMFPGRGLEPELLNQMGQIRWLLMDSVLSTGILPGQQWGNGTVNTGALGNRERQKSPFKMPKIEKRKTSDMHITYGLIELECSACMPEYQGSKVEVGIYTPEIMEGFCSAYEYVMGRKESFRELIQDAFLCKGRYALRHTQQYKMYQMSASFPDLMVEPQRRALMLCRMSEGFWCNRDYKDEIVGYEILSTMHELVPIYYITGSDAITGAGTILKDYFQDSIQEQVIRRIGGLSEKDLYRQRKWIGLSMWAGYPLKKGMHHSLGQQGKAGLTSREVMERILLDMEEENGEHAWIGVHHSESSWHFDTVGIYLYDGLCGIAIFMAAMAKAYGDGKYKKISVVLSERLFQYTRESLEDREKLQSRHTGIFNGESSLIYTYLILYGMTGEERFLTYAEKHSQIVGELLKEDREYDLLHGNAGAAIAMAHMYTVTREENYRDKAQQAADLLLEHGVTYEAGTGWIISGQQVPLAGMAHGNSGIALALASVWEVTKKDAYYRSCLQAIHYENTLYEERTGNWADLRGWENETKLPETDMVAWCHGAGGILIARSRMTELLGKDNEDVEWKLPQALDRVLQAQSSDCCLCHGRAGYAEAVKYYNKVTGEQCGTSNCRGWLDFKGFRSIPAKEGFQAGLMTGLAGLGYALLRQEEEGFPNLLVLEV